MTATPITVDFRKEMDIFQHKSGVIRDHKPKKPRPLSADGKVLTPKQIRARARRKMARSEVMSDQELEYLYEKPIAEWDLAELAAGRPKNKKGHFSGPTPKYISREIHEEAMEKYVAAVKTDMRMTTVDALGLIRELINDTNVDEKGKPIVPPGTKLDAAKFLLEHVIGKPTQRIESDVSVKLQGILGQVMVNPSEMNTGYTLGHYPGITMNVVQEDDDDLEELNG